MNNTDVLMICNICSKTLFTRSGSICCCTPSVIANHVEMLIDEIEMEHIYESSLIYKLKKFFKIFN